MGAGAGVGAGVGVGVGVGVLVAIVLTAHLRTTCKGCTARSAARPGSHRPSSGRVRHGPRAHVVKVREEIELEVALA